MLFHSTYTGPYLVFKMAELFYSHDSNLSVYETDVSKLDEFEKNLLDSLIGADDEKSLNETVKKIISTYFTASNELDKERGVDPLCDASISRTVAFRKSMFFVKTLTDLGKFSQAARIIELVTWNPVAAMEFMNSVLSNYESHSPANKEVLREIVATIEYLNLAEDKVLERVIVNDNANVLEFLVAQGIIDKSLDEDESGSVTLADNCALGSGKNYLSLYYPPLVATSSERKLKKAVSLAISCGSHRVLKYLAEHGKWGIVAPRFFDFAKLFPQLADREKQVGHAKITRGLLSFFSETKGWDTDVFYLNKAILLLMSAREEMLPSLTQVVKTLSLICSRENLEVFSCYLTTMDSLVGAGELFDCSRQVYDCLMNSFFTLEVVE